MSADKIIPLLKNNVLALLILVGFAIFVFTFLALVVPTQSVTSEPGVDVNKRRVASSVISSTVDSINDGIYKAKADKTSRVDGTGGLQAAKGDIWIEGATTPASFYIPAVPMMSKMSNPYVDIKGTVEEYTVTYSDSYLNVTARYNSETDKIEVTEGSTSLMEESQG